VARDVQRDISASIAPCETHRARTIRRDACAPRADQQSAIACEPPAGRQDLGCDRAAYRCAALPRAARDQAATTRVAVSPPSSSGASKHEAHRRVSSRARTTGRPGRAEAVKQHDGGRGVGRSDDAGGEAGELDRSHVATVSPTSIARKST
jgi:hypothetical protein